MLNHSKIKIVDIFHWCIFSTLFDLDQGFSNFVCGPLFVIKNFRGQPTHNTVFQHTSIPELTAPLMAYYNNWSLHQYNSSAKIKLAANKRCQIFVWEFSG